MEIGAGLANLRKRSRRAGGHYTPITRQCGQASSAAPLCPRQNPQQPLQSWGYFSAFSVSAFPCSVCGPWSRGHVVSLSHFSFSVWPSGTRKTPSVWEERIAGRGGWRQRICSNRNRLRDQPKELRPCHNPRAARNQPWMHTIEHPEYHRASDAEAR
jgi:hypothetical protein